MLMEPEQRWEMGENLINEYFSVLVATLRKIGYKGDMPTQRELWEQIQNNKYYGKRVGQVGTQSFSSNTIFNSFQISF